MHFKTPIIVKENGEIKYQFVCHTYVFYFLLQSCLTFQTETLPLSSPGNMRKIQPRTFCVMSNRVKAKLSMPQRALHSGDYLAEELDKCLRLFGIHNKVHNIYLDAMFYQFLISKIFRSLAKCATMLQTTTHCYLHLSPSVLSRLVGSTPAFTAFATS